MIYPVLYWPDSGRNKTKIGFVRTQGYFNRKFNVFVSNTSRTSAITSLPPIPLLNYFGIMEIRHPLLYFTKSCTVFKGYVAEIGRVTYIWWVNFWVFCVACLKSNFSMCLSCVIRVDVKREMIEQTPKHDIKRVCWLFSFSFFLFHLGNSRNGWQYWGSWLPWQAGAVTI